MSAARRLGCHGANCYISQSCRTMTEQKQSPDAKPDARLPKFVLELVEQDVAADKNGRRVMTRLPPEPNGYLPIGHAKSISLNFGISQLFPGAPSNLSFDSTTP